MNDETIGNKYHDFISEDGLICDICGKSRDDCIAAKESQVKLDKEHKEYMKKFKKKNDAKWGSTDLWALTQKPMKNETDYINQKLDNDEDIDLHEQVMQYFFFPTEVYVRSIVCTKSNSFLLSTEGIIYSWGLITPQLGRKLDRKEHAIVPMPLATDLPKFITICAGVAHILALDINGKVWSWGANDQGQVLGQPKSVKLQNDPQRIESFGLMTFIQIFASADISFAVNKAGLIYSWGNNKSGQCGLEEQRVYFEPQPLNDMPWDKESSKEFAHLPYANRTWLYEYKKQAEYLQTDQKQKEALDEQKDQEIRQFKQQIQELSDKINQNKYNQQVSDIPAKQEEKEKEPVDKKMQAKFDDDNVIADLKSQSKNIQSAIEQLLREKQQIEDQIKIEDIDIFDTQQQLDNIGKKEKELRIKSDALANKKKVILRNKASNMEQELQINARDTDTLNELIQANNTIKVTYELSKNKMEEKKKNKISRITQINYEVDEMKKKKAFFNSLTSERETTIMNQYLNVNKANLLKILSDLQGFHNELLASKVTNLVKQSKEFKNFDEFIKDSNKKIKKIDQQIQKLTKVDENSIINEFMTKILLIINDNIKLREEINDLLTGINSQTQNRIEEYYQNHFSQSTISPNIMSRIINIVAQQNLENDTDQIQIIEEIDQLAEIIRENKDSEYQKGKEFIDDFADENNEYNQNMNQSYEEEDKKKNTVGNSLQKMLQSIKSTKSSKSMKSNKSKKQDQPKK